MIPMVAVLSAVSLTAVNVYSIGEPNGWVTWVGVPLMTQVLLSSLGAISRPSGSCGSELHCVMDPPPLLLISMFTAWL